MSNVKLIAKTEPKIDNVLTAEQLLAYIAKVSNPGNQLNNDKAGKLLKYLVNHKHWSPFEMVNMVMEINCSRAIGRQILRHWNFAFQEFSQRYAVVSEDMFEKVEARLQDYNNRQNSLETADQATIDLWDQIQDGHIADSIRRYEMAMSAGIAKEQARVLLPEGLTKSRMYLNGDLRQWIHYCNLRRGNGTQKEHQLIADECWNIICLEFPSLKDILGE